MAKQGKHDKGPRGQFQLSASNLSEFTLINRILSHLYVYAALYHDRTPFSDLFNIYITVLNLIISHFVSQIHV